MSVTQGLNSGVLVADENVILTCQPYSPQGLDVFDSQPVRVLVEITRQLYPDSISYPIITIGILGKQTKGERNLFTEWLIEYFSHDEPINLDRLRDNLFNYKGFKHLVKPGVNLSTNSGKVYLWPSPIVSKSGDKTFLVWILYTDTDRCDKIETFICNICSTLIILETSDRNRFNNLAVKGYTNFNYNSIYILNISELVNQLRFSSLSSNIPSVVPEYFRRLRTLSYQPKTGMNNKRITIEEIAPYFKSVASFLHFDLVVDTPAFLNHSKHLPGNMNQNVNPDAYFNPTAHSKSSEPSMENMRHSNVSKNLEPFAETSTCTYSDTLKMTSVGTDIPAQANNHKQQKNVNNNEQNKSSNDIKILNQVVQMVIHWIEHNLNIVNIENTAILLTSQIAERHPIYNEVVILLTITQSTCQDILNMLFDNYVCFRSDADKRHFNRILHLSKKQIETVLASKKLTYKENIYSLMQAAFSKVVNTLNKVNNHIVQNEQTLALEVLSRIQIAYRKKVSVYFDGKYHIKNPALVETVHTRLVEYFKGVTFRSLNTADKSNYIVLCSYDKLRQNLESELQTFKKSYESTFNSHVETPIMKEKQESYPMIDQAIVRYVSEIEKLPMNSTYKAFHLIDKHYDVVSQISKDIDEQLKFDLRQHSTRYPTFLLETHEENLQLEKYFSLDLEVPLLCIYISGRYIKMGMQNQEKSSLVVFRPNNDTFAPAEIAVSLNGHFYFGHCVKKLTQRRQQAAQSIVDVILSAAYDKNAAYHLWLLLSELKKLAMDQFKIAFQAAIIVLPSYFEHKALHSIRNALRGDGFRNTFFVKDTSALAYGLLDTNIDKEIIVIACDFKSLLGFEIFSTKHSAHVYLLAMSYGEKPKTLVSQKPQNLFNRVWSRLYGNTNDKTIITPVHPDNQKKFLNTLYDKALCQLNHQERICKKRFIIRSHTDATEYHNLLRIEFLKNHTDLELTHIENQHDYILQTALKLSKQPNLIRTKIIDHTMWKYTENIEPTAKNVSKVSMQSNFEGHKEQSETLKLSYEDETKKSEQDLKNKNKMKSKLLKHCSLIKQEVSAGKVNLRGLVKKFVNESVERAEIIVNDPNSTLPMLEEEFQEICRIYKEHRFGT